MSEQGAVNDEGAVTEPDESAEQTEATEPESDEAAMKRKFQEAIARKHGGGGAATPGATTQSRGVGPSSGGKVQRQFRRKAGG